MPLVFGAAGEDARRTAGETPALRFCKRPAFVQIVAGKSEGHLDREEALEFAVHPDDLKSLLRNAA